MVCYCQCHMVITWLLNTLYFSICVEERHIHGCTGLILFGGGGGHSISLPDRFAYTVHIYNFVRDFIRAFFKDFPVGRGIF